MKRAMNIFSIWGIALAVLALVVMFSFPIGGVSQESPETQARTNFPVGAVRPVDLEMDAQSLAQLTHREHRDQSLDWLLMTVLSTQLSTEQLNEVTFDLPAVRFGYMRPVANFEYGDIRSRYIGDGRVVALVPAEASAEQLADYLAQIFDEHRKNQAEPPRTLDVFAFTLKLSEQSATLKRLASVAGEELLSAKYGYFETPVRNVQDLSRFMGETDSLTYAKVTDNTLLVGGRKVKARSYRNVRVEDVAALWQSETSIHEKLTEFKAKWDAREAEFRSRWDGKTYRTTWERDRAQIQLNREQDEFQRAYTREREALHIVNGSGFSLDPSYDYRALSVALRTRATTLFDLPAMQSFSTEWGEALDAVDQNQVVPLLVLIDKLEKSGRFETMLTAQFLNDLERRHTYQAARYDGELQGTEVGMVLFYTDVLAKLWALDYKKSHPSKFISDFASLLDVSVSPVFEAETAALPGTRLWFGPLSKGFQVANAGDTLLLSQFSTRVYAASSNPMQPGVEQEAAAWAEAFLSWWNDHYEEIGRHEPEYERLNEIMKWSLLVGWLNNSSNGKTLEFLAPVKIVRTHRFPQWVAKHPELRFKNWSAVGFLPAGAKGSKTEAMPTLYSESRKNGGRSGAFSGGVSLADKSLFEKLAHLPVERNKLFSRSNLDYTAISGGGKVLRSLDHVSYDLSANNTLRATVKEGTKARSRLGEVAAGSFDRTISAETGGGLKIQSQIGGRDVGTLRIQGDGNKFKVNWRGRDLDLGHSVAWKMSKAENPRTVLAQDSRVEAIVEYPDSQAYAVKMRGSTSWFKFAPEDQPSVAIAEGWQARVSDAKSGKKNIQFAMRDTKALFDEVKGEGFVAVERIAGTDRVVVKYLGARGPPANAQRAAIESGNTDFNAYPSKDPNSILVHLAELPEDIRSDPGRLHELATRLDVATIRQASAQGKKVVLGNDNGGHHLPPNGFAKAFNEGDPNRIFREWTADPKKAREELNAQFKQQLALVDEHIKRRDFASAIDVLAEQGRMFEEHPEVLLRRGIARLEMNDDAQAAKVFEQVRFSSERSRGRFFDEVNRRVHEAGHETDTSMGLLAMFARQVKWKDAIHHRLVPDGEVMVKRVGADVRLEYAAKEKLKLEEIAADDKFSDGVALYSQDSPTLNNVDWSAGTVASLRQISQNGWGKAYKLSREDLAAFQPDRIHAPELVTEGQSRTTKAASTTVKHVGRTGGGSPGECDPNSQIPSSQCPQVKPTTSPALLGLDVDFKTKGTPQRFVIIVLAENASSDVVKGADGRRSVIQ